MMGVRGVLGQVNEKFKNVSGRCALVLLVLAVHTCAAVPQVQVMSTKQNRQMTYGVLAVCGVLLLFWWFR